MKNALVFIVVMFLCSQGVWAKEAKVQAEVLTQSSVSWNGEAYRYPQGEAEISVVKIDIPKGIVLPLHCHNIPLAGYMVKGELEVSTASGEKKLFKAGDAFVEVMDLWHFGSAITDTQLIAFYAGQRDMPLSVSKQGQPALANRCK